MEWIKRQVQAKSRDTHQRIALDAVFALRGPEAVGWQRLFLREHESYLRGSVAPERQFKDFSNHVLYVNDGFWGGACESAVGWYRTLIEALRQAEWSHAAYCAGVVGHYVADVQNPLHTAHAEENGVVGQALERSVYCCYDSLTEVLINSFGGVPEIEVPQVGDWLPRLLRSAAEVASRYHRLLLDHYDLGKGATHPEAGFDDACIEVLARLLGNVLAIQARTLEHAFVEARVLPPRVDLTIPGCVSFLSAPLDRWAGAAAAQRNRLRIVRAREESVATGKVIENLSEAERAVRRAYAHEVRRTPLSELDREPAQPTGTKHGEEVSLSAWRFRPTTLEPSNQRSVPSQGRLKPVGLNASSPIDEAPSVDGSVAARLASLGIRTIADWLRVEPAHVVRKLPKTGVDVATVRRWQAQAELLCSIPALSELQAQLLVGSGIVKPAQLLGMTAAEVSSSISRFVRTPVGRAALGSNTVPGPREISRWIEDLRLGQVRRAA